MPHSAVQIISMSSGLASPTGPELGTAQPQLVIITISVSLSNVSVKYKIIINLLHSFIYLGMEYDVYKH